MGLFDDLPPAKKQKALEKMNHLSVVTIVFLCQIPLAESIVPKEEKAVREEKSQQHPEDSSEPKETFDSLILQPDTNVSHNY